MQDQRARPLDRNSTRGPRRTTSTPSERQGENLTHQQRPPHTRELAMHLGVSLGHAAHSALVFPRAAERLGVWGRKRASKTNRPSVHPSPAEADKKHGPTTLTYPSATTRCARTRVDDYTHPAVIVGCALHCWCLGVCLVASPRTSAASMVQLPSLPIVRSSRGPPRPSSPPGPTAGTLALSCSPSPSAERPRTEPSPCVALSLL